ncbi:hypothetical protein [Nocardia sputorum]|uniref:Uncharacterized protein n=1 Tax=Nocardia sputorum TaxID=2984338 RepID=A0ABM8D096_9NOCA|nr:hypothetical protein [Nocardia sputorum]BDU00751.1 hypothetical protein IFM12276_37790 [Nocardia sputorum]
MAIIWGKAVRWVSDYQPGIIEVEFTDIDGVTHSLIDKLPIFGATDDLGPDSAYPAPVEIGVTLIEQLGDATVIDLGTEAHNTDPAQRWLRDTVRAALGPPRGENTG